MIELTNDQKLYYIKNNGCDDTTTGLAVMTDIEFAKFKEIIENLNKNSTYGCMPTIVVYKIVPDNKFVEITENEDDKDYALYLNGKIYKDCHEKYFWYEKEGERVI